MSRRGRISLDHLHCYKDGEIRSAEPYLLTAFFKIDGEGNFIDVKDGQFFIGGSCTFRATPGSHGNLGTRHVSNGADVSIPPPIGESTFAIEPITAAGIGLPDTKISGFVGVVVALMEENWLTESAANAGHVAFNRTLVRKINEIVPTLRQGMTQIPPGDIELVKKELEARVKAAVIDKETDGDFFGLLNADVLIGADLFVAGKSRDIRARLQRTQTVQPPTPPQTIVTHDYMLFGRIEVNGNPVFIGPPFSIVGVGDFNGNGRADIVWHNASTHETQLWYMDNHQLVDRGTVLGLDGNPVFIGPPFSIVGVGDFNGNGRADIVWHNASTHETQLWYMDNHQLVDRGTVLGLDGNPVFIGPPFSIVGVGDFNGNGRADIVWHNASTHETQLWYMDNAPAGRPRHGPGPRRQPGVHRATVQHRRCRRFQRQRPRGHRVAQRQYARDPVVVHGQPPAGRPRHGPGPRRQPGVHRATVQHRRCRRFQRQRPRGHRVAQRQYARDPGVVHGQPPAGRPRHGPGPRRLNPGRVRQYGTRCLDPPSSTRLKSCSRSNTAR